MVAKAVVVDEVVVEEVNDDGEVAELPIDPNEELWPDGPTMGQIDKWKEEFGEDSVYVTSLTPTQHVVWRTLSRPEYRESIKGVERAVAEGRVTQAEASLDNEEEITELCSLFPKYVRGEKNTLAGLPSLISQQVTEASGFSALEVRLL